MAHPAFISMFFAGRSSLWLESPRLSGDRAPSPGGKSLPRSIISGSIDRHLSTVMVQKQHHKSNAKKQPHITVKKQGKQADNAQFRAQLDVLGHASIIGCPRLLIKALADQSKGNEDEHGKYRSMVVQYILEYCKTMDNDGMELQAASLVTRSNICIHRNMSPRWYICNFDQPGARIIHLSYHDEEHYNSVRLKEDTRDGPARPITIKADSNLSASSRQAKAGSNKSKSGAGKDITDAGSIKLVTAGSGCENIEKVEQETVQSPCNADASYGDDANGNSEEQREEPMEETYKDNPPSNSAKRTHDDGSAWQEDKKIPRNKACPCGSKKKYKSCCGSGTGKVSAISNDQALGSRKSRKEKKRSKRGSDTSALSTGSDGGPPDMGALCI
ncbi:hypothetical protein BT93_H1618 [Corymbia citriodora subsp. variegata]|nr:hypothetical protein BT93_H1618 [Corymbia citriodora subsp. variegata]